MGKTSILGVLRLRAVNPLLGDTSARRFAQDDGLVGVLKNIPVGCTENKRSHNLSRDSGQTKLPHIIKSVRSFGGYFVPRSRGQIPTSGKDAERNVSEFRRQTG